MPVKSNRTKKTNTLTFRLSPDLRAQLEEHAKTLRDEAGLPLSAQRAARKLVVDALKKLREDKGT